MIEQSKFVELLKKYVEAYIEWQKLGGSEDAKAGIMSELDQQAKWLFIGVLNLEKENAELRQLINDWIILLDQKDENFKLSHVEAVRNAMVLIDCDGFISKQERTE